MSVPVLHFSAMTDAEVSELLARYQIGLTVAEARQVESMLKRPPTVTEAVIWGIQGSEHCSYKSSRRFLKAFCTDGPHVILGPKEDSGIVAITDGPTGKRWGLVVSHESHNKPSQVVPFEGAATGVGGCVRDVACMGARVLGSMDSLRLGDPRDPAARAIASEVMRGIAAYGNALGIPNLGGDTAFDASNNHRCLVNVVSVGIVREDEIIHSFVPSEAGRERYDIIVVGKPTDRSGFGGAAFASASIEEGEGSQTKRAGAVQEPNPFLERHLLASTYALFDWLSQEKQLHRVSFKDHGAGGNVCSSVEQVAAAGLGADINLDLVHTAIKDLPPEVIACAETQERFCWVCHPSLTQTILKHYNVVWDLPSVAEGARASVIGHVTEDPTYTLRHRGDVVCSAKASDITLGLQYTRPTRAVPDKFSEPTITCTGSTVSVAGHSLSIDAIVRTLHTHPSYASKSRVLRHYDKNILANVVIEAGEADASVIMPLVDLSSFELDTPRSSWVQDLRPADARVGVALACGGNSRYGRISPYLQGLNAVVENVRNVAAVGATPRAITDCLNYGNPEIPEHLWMLEEGVRGIADAARSLQFSGSPIPIISGNVSLYNFTPKGSIDPTANVCVIGVLPDGSKAATMPLKRAGSALYYVGSLKDECGGSAYYRILEEMTKADDNDLLGSRVPHPDLRESLRDAAFVIRAISSDLLLSTHDISEGGLLLALFEMTVPARRVATGLGIDIDLERIAGGLRTDAALFSETGAFIVEVSRENTAAFETLAASAGVCVSRIGSVTSDERMTIRRNTTTVYSGDLTELTHTWSSALDAVM